MDVTNILSLKLLVFSPLVMAVIFLLPVFYGHEVMTRRIAKSFAGMHFVYTCLFYLFFNNELIVNYPTEITFFGQHWIPSLGINLSFGLDGISLLFVILTSFLVLMSCIATKGIIKSKHGLYFSLIFLLETAVLGVFSSTDMFLFFLFWELELIPMYFLISLWGSGKAKKSAMKFLLYTFIGSLFMLLGLLMVYSFNYIATGELSADIQYLNLDVELTPVYLQLIASILILFGFAVKIPLVPFHTWLPDAHTDAPAPVSMLLAGILLKMGGYGILRFNMTVLSDSFMMIVPYIVALSFINILFAAIAAYKQTDVKRIVAYSSISSMGIVVLGLCSLNVIGLTGAIFLMIAHGITSAGLFYVVGIIYKRTNTREITQLGGLVKVIPRISGFTLVLIVACMGVPSTIGFVGEVLSFFGSFWSGILNNYYIQVITLCSILVLILSACYSLRFLHGIFYGEIQERWKKLKDLSNHEFFVLTVFSFVIFLFGLLPMVLINVFMPVVRTIAGIYGG